MSEQQRHVPDEVVIRERIEASFKTSGSFEQQHSAFNKEFPQRAAELQMKTRSIMADPDRDTDAMNWEAVHAMVMEVVYYWQSLELFQQKYRENPVVTQRIELWMDSIRNAAVLVEKSISIRRNRVGTDRPIFGLVSFARQNKLANLWSTLLSEASSADVQKKQEDKE